MGEDMGPRRRRKILILLLLLLDRKYNMLSKWLPICLVLVSYLCLVLKPLNVNLTNTKKKYCLSVTTRSLWKLVSLVSGISMPINNLVLTDSVSLLLVT